MQDSIWRKVSNETVNSRSTDSAEIDHAQHARSQVLFDALDDIWLIGVLTIDCRCSWSTAVLHAPQFGLGLYLNDLADLEVRNILDCLRADVSLLLLWEDWC